jgi:glycosyltransferase involved in cell wall biosynthesis
LRRLVFVTQRVDPADPNLGATVPKLRALAGLFDEVVVLTDSAVPRVLPANCRIATFGSSTRAGRGFRFAGALARELLRRPRPQAVLAHMVPLYAILAAPLVRPARVRLLLWYTHWQVSAALRLAERVSDVVLSVDRRSFPLPSRKLVPIGHGIDLAAFGCRPTGGDGPLQAVVLRRYSTAKGLETIVRAAPLVPAVRLTVRGPALSDAERRHREALRALAGGVELADALPRTEVPALLAASDVLVNNMRAGAADKVVLEAAASCVPVLASDPGWADLLDGLELPLRFGRDDPEELAHRLSALAAAGGEARARIGRALRERVAAGHSVEAWARRVSELASSPG